MTTRFETFFQPIVGHNVQLGDLARMGEQENVPHALLFVGPSGIGKRTVGQAFAASLLASRTSAATDDNIAKTKKLVELGHHPDLHFLSREEGKKDISAAAVRELCTTLRLKPYEGNAAVVIVNDAHLMNITAANALLMTLEEAPAHSYLFLITDSPHRLPETVISRCQTVLFAELSETEISKVVENICEPLGINSKTQSNLSALLDGSLAPLQLDPYIDERTLGLVEEAEAKEHLQAVCKESARLSSELARVLDRTNGASVDSAIAFADQVAAEKTGLPFFWPLLHKTVRRTLRDCDTDRSSAWAKVLQQSIDTERLITERNANPQLQLTALMLSMWETSREATA